MFVWEGLQDGPITWFRCFSHCFKSPIILLPFECWWAGLHRKGSINCEHVPQCQPVGKVTREATHLWRVTVPVEWCTAIWWIWCNTTQYDAIWCNIMRYHAVSCIMSVRAMISQHCWDGNEVGVAEVEIPLPWNRKWMKYLVQWKQGR